MTKTLLKTLNAVEFGVKYELNVSSVVKAAYSPLNKLISVEFSFDVMSFMQQLRFASGKSDFTIVPNTLLIAKEDSNEARLVIESCIPYRVIFSNSVSVLYLKIFSFFIDFFSFFFNFLHRIGVKCMAMTVRK